MATRLMGTPARVVKYSNTLDTFRRYLTDDPTPAKIANLMRDADDGDTAALFELTWEMESKDAHLQGVASRRREAVTALDWEIVPEIRTDDKKGAELAAEYCTDQLLKLKSWSGTLKHLQHATGPGFAVTELIWRRGQLIQTVDVPGHRFLKRPWIDNRVRIETDDSPVDGAPVYSPGYILHCPNPQAGFESQITVTRAQAILWIIKHFAIADWAVFSEQYGTPWRIATVKGGADSNEIAHAEAMMRDMASDTWGVFTENIEFKFLEAARTNQPYEPFVDWCERKQSILILGQTLTTEQQNVGSLALGAVHDNVRASVGRSDIKAEAETMDEQVLAPMVKFWRPRERLPVPHWKRKIIEKVDVEERRLRMDQIRLGKEMGLTMDKDFLHESLDIPQPKGDETETTDGEPETPQ